MKPDKHIILDILDILQAIVLCILVVVSLYATWCGMDWWPKSCVTTIMLMLFVMTEKRVSD